MAAVLERLAIGSMSTLLNTGATLANNALAISSAYNNTTGQTGDGYTRGLFTFSGTFGTAPSANTGLSCWLIKSNDAAGGTYEDGDASTTPARPADFVLPVRAVNTAQVIAILAELVPGLLKLLAKNDATGQTINSGWTITLTPITASFT